LKKNAVDNDISKDTSGLPSGEPKTADTTGKPDSSGQPDASQTVKQGKSMGRDISGGDSGSRPVDPRVARRRQDPLGRRLRQMYEEVVGEDVPDDFLSFLEKADERLTSGGDDSGPASQEPGKKSKS